MIDNGICSQNRQRTFSFAVLGRRCSPKFDRSHPGFVLVISVLLSCSGCQSSPKAPLAEQQHASTAVTLSPGDVIKLSFTATPDLNQSQKIRADGKVNLPLIGEVTAAGKTLPNFQNELVRLYKPQLRNSQVVVTLESGIMQVVVSGAVVKPQKLQFDRPTSVFQAIMEAGGVNEFGNLKKVRLIRTVNGQQQSQVLDLSPTLRGENTQAFYIKDGDVIFVPQSVF
jgi:polysaccharide export outer membrane protein